MKKLIAILLCILFAGCSNSISTLDLYRFDGISAYATTLELKEESKPIIDCKCNGTRKVKSGDGLLEVPCKCGSHCKCKGSDDVKVLGIQIWYFGQKSCGPCRKVKNNVLPALRKNGWKIANAGSGQEAHVVIFDLDKNPDLINKYNITDIPLFIRTVDNKEVSRHEGYLNPQGIGHLFNGTPLTESDES